MKGNLELDEDEKISRNMSEMYDAFIFNVFSMF